jgi:NAD(P)-dependent dehydrogenase (short-subunit alcohol dehydrogenase family)
MSDLNGKWRLSRGIARRRSRHFAFTGFERRRCHYQLRSKGPRAEEVAESVRAAGRRAFLAQADITDEAEVEAMIRLVVKSEDSICSFSTRAAVGKRQPPTTRCS